MRIAITRIHVCCAVAVAVTALLLVATPGAFAADGEVISRAGGAGSVTPLRSAAAAAGQQLDGAAAAEQHLHELAAQSPPRVRLTLMAPDGTVVADVRGNDPVLAASMAKLSVAGCLLGETRRGTQVSAAERRLLARMLRRSDNAAADTLRRRVPKGCAARLARAAGFTHTRPGGRWGVANLSARDAARLAHVLPAFVDERHRALLLELLGTVVPQQAWGRDRMPDGVVLRAKPGMLPPRLTDGRGALAGQAGVIDVAYGSCPGRWSWGVIVDRAGTVPQASARIALLVEQAARIAALRSCQ